MTSGANLPPHRVQQQARSRTKMTAVSGTRTLQHQSEGAAELQQESLLFRMSCPVGEKFTDQTVNAVHDDVEIMMTMIMIISMCVDMMATIMVMMMMMMMMLTTTALMTKATVMMKTV